MVVNIDAQFDTLIFLKGIYQSDYNYNSIYPLGDQNRDGFDDIMLYDCNDKRGYIYFGGSPMDTVAVNSIQFFDSVNIGGSIAVIDLNDDNVNDVVATSVFLSDSGFYYLGPIRIYYGGDIIDSIPNLTFNPPQGATGAVPQVLEDFNGDGRSELVIYDGNLPFSSKQYGTLYFYNTESQFDTIFHYTLTGDSVNFIRYYAIDSSGDINGDGKIDFTMYGIIGEKPPYNFFRKFYLGNENFDLEPDVTYYQNEHFFKVEYMKILNDINGDSKDDILIKDYGFYPYYYRFAILHSSFPIDTIPDVGLNTQNLGLDISQTHSLGDVNGDGYNDFFGKDGGFYPNVKLWVGGREMPYTSDDQANKTWSGTSSGFGRIISGVGDVDGDSVNDIAICELPYGDPTDCKMSLVYIFRGDTSVIGDTGTVSVTYEDDVIEDYHLYDPYPNPFNPSTIINYQLPINNYVTIKIYDVLGKEVATLVNEEQPAGIYEIEFDAEKYNISSGTYFYKLKTEGGEITRKMLYLK
jgi:hypothetical protein